MPDVRFDLYHGDLRDEPVRTLEAEYATLARKNDRELTDDLATGFEGAVESVPMILTIFKQRGNPGL